MSVIQFRKPLPWQQCLKPMDRLKFIARTEREIKRLEVHLLELEQPYPKLWRLMRKFRQMRRIFA